MALTLDIITEANTLLNAFLAIPDDGAQQHAFLSEWLADFGTRLTKETVRVANENPGVPFERIAEKIIADLEATSD